MEYFLSWFNIINSKRPSSEAVLLRRTGEIPGPYRRTDRTRAGQNSKQFPNNQKPKFKTACFTIRHRQSYHHPDYNVHMVMKHHKCIYYTLHNAILASLCMCRKHYNARCNYLVLLFPSKKNRNMPHHICCSHISQ